MPEGDEDLKVVEGVTEELETVLKQNGITTKLKLIAVPDKKLTELTGDRKLTKSIKISAILLSKPVDNVAV
jgi:predicted flap endonuclease-1-like 5' DNA nuclease